jgi:hypothetical protein
MIGQICGRSGDTYDSKACATLQQSTQNVCLVSTICIRNLLQSGVENHLSSVKEYFSPPVFRLRTAETMQNLHHFIVFSNWARIIPKNIGPSQGGLQLTMLVSIFFDSITVISDRTLVARSYMSVVSLVVMAAGRTCCASVSVS